MSSCKYTYIIKGCLILVLLSYISVTVYASEDYDQQLEIWYKQIDEQVDREYSNMSPEMREGIKQQLKDSVKSTYLSKLQEENKELADLQAAEDEDKEIITVNSKEDFLEWVSFQLRDQKKELYYDTNLNELYNNADEIFDSIDAFYYESNPIISSSYLGRYRDNDHPLDYSWAEKYVTDETRYRIGITIPDLYTKEEIQGHMSDMEKLSKELQKENDYKSVKAVHDYLIENFEWEKDISDDIAGFREGKMNSLGYSMAAFALLTNMNIPVRIVGGKVIDDDQLYDNHWNIVQLDGQWYNLDVTWDDNGEYKTRYDWFLRNNDDFVHHIYGSKQVEIKKMISEVSYPVEEGLFIAGEASNDPQKNIGNSSDNEESPKKISLKKILTSRGVLRIIIYCFFTIIFIIRNRITEWRLNANSGMDDLSADIAKYYKDAGREQRQLIENNRRQERWMLATILLYFTLVVVLMGIVYIIYLFIHK
ncbi:MAG: hypothetical protein IJ661_02160 [Lachnospiraceae bacterium]|nr:hypothetical protein [Lachnospiraceae bacterium]